MKTSISFFLLASHIVLSSGSLLRRTQQASCFMSATWENGDLALAVDGTPVCRGWNGCGGYAACGSSVTLTSSGTVDVDISVLGFTVFNTDDTVYARFSGFCADSSIYSTTIAAGGAGKTLTMASVC